MPDKPKILNTTTVGESQLFRLEAVDLRFSNGVERTFERIRGTRGAGTVLIIPMPDPNTIYLVREYAVGTERYELGFPKGIMEPNEDPLDAANRELQEEIGFGSNDLQCLKPMRNAPGYMGGIMNIVLARDLYPKQLPGDEPEPIEVEQWSLDQYDELLKRDDFSEARSIAALLMIKFLKV